MARHGCALESCDLTTVEAPGGVVDPTVLTTDDGTRAIAIRLEAGQMMNDHQVRERTWLVVVEGRARIRCGDHAVDGGVGTFEPGERHAVSSDNGALLAPWPGPGHYLDGKNAHAVVAAAPVLRHAPVSVLPASPSGGVSRATARRAGP